MRNLPPLVGAVGVVLAAGFWFFNEKPQVAERPPAGTAELDQPKLAELPPQNPFERQDPVKIESVASNKPATATVVPISTAPITAPPPVKRAADTRAYEIAASEQNWSDEQYQFELNRLRNDQPLLRALVEEFLNENDPARLRRLSMLLGNFDDPVVLQALEQLINADASARAVGFDVLGRLQSSSSPARALAIDKIQNGTQPSVLVGAMNALSTVGEASTNDRRNVQRRATELTTHSDPAVRQRAVSTVANWTLDSSATDILVRGLNDNDPAVRRSSAYAFVDYPHSNQTAVQALLQRAEDPSEERRTRRAAALVLRSMSLSERQRGRLNSAAAEMEL